jgi:signal transduction protein with GAF and PtsI domain
MDGSDELLNRLSEVAADLGPALEPPGYQDLLTELTTAVRNLLSAAACSIAVLDRETEELEFVAASGEGADKILGARMSGAAGIAGWVLASGQSITVTQVQQDPRFAAEVAASTGYVPNSLFAIPLEFEGDVLGVMEVLDATGTASGEEAEEVSLLTRQAALALRVSSMFQDLGTVLFRAAANMAKDADLGEVLEEAARRARGPTKELAELSALFYELGRLGPDERGAGIRVLTAFLTYALSREPMP